MSARVALVQPHAGLLKFGGGGGASSSIVGMQSATAGMQQLVLLSPIGGYERALPAPLAAGGVQRCADVHNATATAVQLSYARRPLSS